MRIAYSKKEEILNLYKQYRHIEKTSVEVKIPKRYVRNLLVQERVELNHQNKVGLSSKHSLTTRQKISESLRRKREKRLCDNPSCDKEFEVLPSSTKSFCSRECVITEKTKHPVAKLDEIRADASLGSELGWAEKKASKLTDTLM